MALRTQTSALSRMLTATALVAALALTGCSKSTTGEPVSEGAVTTSATASPRSTASPQADFSTSATTESASRGAANSGSVPEGDPPSETVVPVATKADPAKANELMGQADALQARGSYSEASTMYQDAMQADPDNLELPYKSACNYARWGKSEEAIESLGVAADMGYADAAAVKASDAFGKLKENPRFQKIVSHIEKN